MSHKNEDVVRRLMDAVNAGDFACVPDFFSDDVVLVLHGEAATLAGGGAAGKEAFIGWFADWFRTFEPGYRFELSDVHSEGDLVHASVTHRARGRASGADVTMPSAWVYTLRDGLIVRADGSSAFGA